MSLPARTSTDIAGQDAKHPILPRSPKALISDYLTRPTNAASPRATKDLSLNLAPKKPSPRLATNEMTDLETTLITPVVSNYIPDGRPTRLVNHGNAGDERK
jgi:hypothetical protein